MKLMDKAVMVVIIFLLTTLPVHSENYPIDFSELFSKHGSVMLIIEVESGRIVDANQAAVDFYGYSREELLDMSIQDINTMAPEEVLEERRKAAEQKRNYFTFSHRLASGEIRQVEVYSYPFGDGDGQFLYSIIHDITQEVYLDQLLKTRNATFITTLGAVVFILLLVTYKLAISLKNISRVKNQLIKSEAKFRSYIDNAPDGIFVVNDQGKYLEVNKAATTMTGYSEQELVGMDIMQNIPEQAHSKAHGFLKNLHQKGRANEELPFVHKDGSIRQWRVNVVKISDNHYLGLAQDITERKAADERLKKITYEYEQVFNGTQDSMFLVEVVNNNEFRYIRNNLSHQLKTGIKPVDIQGKTPRELVGPELGDVIAANYSIAAYACEPITYEETLDLPGGKNTWFTTLTPIAVDGKVTYIVGSSVDITDFKRAQNALIQSEVKFRSYVENASDIILTLNSKKIITYVSPNVKRLKGYDASELKDRLYTDFIHPDDVNSMSKAVEDAFEQKYFQGEIEYRVKHKDGSWGWFAITGSIIEDADNEIIFIGIARNINERKHYEQQLEYLSLHDKLTGLHNRALFESEIKRLQNSREYPITIISFDLDGLKIINDTMGHGMGDKFIKVCADVIRKNLRDSDILARIGGDEFASILPQTDEKSAEKIVERIRRGIARYNKGKPDLPLNISIGIATADNNQKNLEQILKEADERMYHEKLIQKQSSRSQIIDSLLAALAEKDYITEGHSQRLSHYSKKIGRRLKLPSNTMTNLDLLSKVHDLGKVGIPDNILFKKGPLTDEEWTIMRQHPEKGYRIAIVSPDLAGVADLILKHHERWDGSGYPLGLKGNDIPIECRILAIADAFDAMTSNRPYRKAKSREEAIHEIKRFAGIQFDPELVDIFISGLGIKEDIHAS